MQIRGKPMGKYIIYQHWFTRQWRWKFKSSNGNIIAVSSESYINRTDCISSIKLMKNCADAPVGDK